MMSMGLMVGRKYICGRCDLATREEGNSFLSQETNDCDTQQFNYPNTTAGIVKDREETRLGMREGAMIFFSFLLYLLIFLFWKP